MSIDVGTLVVCYASFGRSWAGLDFALGLLTPFSRVEIKRASAAADASAGTRMSKCVVTEDRGGLWEEGREGGRGVWGEGGGLVGGVPVGL